MRNNRTIVVGLAVGLAAASGCTGDAGGGPSAGGGGQGAGGQAGAAPLEGSGGMGGMGGMAGGVGGPGGAVPIRVIDPGLAGMTGGAAGAGVESAPVPGVLELVAGQLGGDGNIDGIGNNARFQFVSDMTFDPDDNRVFVRDVDGVRAIDGDTVRVTPFAKLPEGELHYQRGSLYVAHPEGTQLTQVSPTDGHVIATIVEQDGPKRLYGHPLLAWPDGNAMFQVSDDGRLWRIETATGNVSVTPLAGFPVPSMVVPTTLTFATWPVMTGPTTILVSVYIWDNDVGPQLNVIVSVDIPTATATVVDTVPIDSTVVGIDPQGQFAILNTGTIPLGSSGVTPAFPASGPLMMGPRGTVLMSSGAGVFIWDRTSAPPAQWAGLDLRIGPAMLGPGASSIFQNPPLAIAVRANQAYVTWELAPDSLMVIDLATNIVSALTQAKAGSAGAVLPLADGTLYLSEQHDCSVWQLGPMPAAAPRPLSPAMDSCLTNGLPSDTARSDWVTSGLVSFDGSLLMVSTGVPGVVQIDPIQGTWSVHGFFDRDGVGEPDNLRLSGAAVGSDGLLYAVDGQRLYRIDHGLHSATVVGQGGLSVAADTSGHIYTTAVDTVLRYDISTGQTLRVAGVPGSRGISLGALPGSLNLPRGLAVTDAGDLLIGNTGEYVVLRARFQ